MAVDDAELLALAGGDSSEEDEAPQQQSHPAKVPSPLPSIEISRDDSDKFAAKYGRSTAKGRASSGKAKKKSRRDDSDDEEEGEASSTPASPDSQRSAAMSESDSRSSAMDKADDDGHPFPVENKFYSEKDKREIMALPEIERESILAERAAQHERKMLDIRLRRIFQAREADAKSSASSKRKAGTDLEDSPRKSSRQKTTLGGRKVGETSGAIEAYKRQREEKGQRDEKRRLEGLARKQRRARSSSDLRAPSADVDGESEVEWDEGKSKEDDERAQPSLPADYNDFRRVTWTRNMLAQFCFFPGFEEAIRDCFVRTPSKPHPTTQQVSYELLQVKRVVEKKGYEYAVEKPDQKRFVTNQHLVCVVDGTERDYYIGMVSNTVVSEVEVANYKNNLANDGKNPPLQRSLVNKLDQIQAMIHHRFTDAEVQRKLERSGVIKRRTAPAERLEIVNRRQAAIDSGDEAAIAKADSELAAFDGTKLKYGTFLIDPRAQNNAPAEPSQQDRLAELNRLNRKRNTEEVRRAQLAEQKAARLARQALERGEGVQDPFARVKTHAKTHHDINETLAPHRAKQIGGSREVSRSVSPGGLTPKLGPKKDIIKVPSPLQKPKSGMAIKSQNLDDDFLGSLDMGIDVDIV